MWWNTGSSWICKGIFKDLIDERAILREAIYATAYFEVDPEVVDIL